jgi:hypothetical protein
VKPTQHETITGAEAADLPVGSVIMSPSYGPPGSLRTKGPRGYIAGDALGRVDLSPTVKYLKLYIPAPDPPQIGDELTLEQLEALAHHAVVVGDRCIAWQRIGAGRFAGSTGAQFSAAFLREENRTLTLVWLPTEADL